MKGYRPMASFFFLLSSLQLKSTSAPHPVFLRSSPVPRRLPRRRSQQHTSSRPPSTTLLPSQHRPATTPVAQVVLSARKSGSRVVSRPRGAVRWRGDQRRGDDASASPGTVPNAAIQALQEPVPNAAIQALREPVPNAAVQALREISACPGSGSSSPNWNWEPYDRCRRESSQGTAAKRRHPSLALGWSPLPMQGLDLGCSPSPSCNCKANDSARRESGHHHARQRDD